MRGRKPKPSKTIQPTTKLGHVPEWIDPAAKLIYRRLATELSQVLCGLDTNIVALYSQCLARYRQAEESITRDGLTLPNYRPNPAIKQSDALLRQLRGLGAELGLSPLSRGRITAPTQPTDQLDDFLRICDPT